MDRTQAVLKSNPTHSCKAWCKEFARRAEILVWVVCYKLAAGLQKKSPAKLLDQ